MDDEIEFDDWFKREGYDESHREQFKIVWNAALYSACARFEHCEGTDHGTQNALEA